MACRIEFYADESGRMPALDWIRDDLDLLQRRVLGTVMREILLQQRVGSCGTPFERHLGRGLFEFRLHESGLLLRLFCYIYGESVVLVLHGYDKRADASAKRQAREVAEARRRLVRWRQRHPDWQRWHERHPEVMTRQPADDFGLILADISAEAVSEGKAAMQDLRALQFKYRVINLLIQRRRTLNWTQKQLAERSGIKQAEIGKIERGWMSPMPDTLTRLAVALDLDLDLDENIFEDRASSSATVGGASAGESGVGVEQG